MTAETFGAAAYRDAPPDSGVMKRPNLARMRCAEGNCDPWRRENVARRFGIVVARIEVGETV